MKVSDGAWSLEQSPMTGRGDFHLRVSGRFTGDGASGELVMKATGACPGQLTTTWTATHQKADAATAAGAATSQPRAFEHLKLTSALLATFLGVPADMQELVWQDEGGTMTIQFKDGRAHGGMTSLREPKP